jgi:DNA repair protein RecO (recombination protein O)
MTAPLQAYVLHQWPWSESSLIVDLFTRERGRIVAVAKGARRPYSQLRPVLLPFQRVGVLFGRAPLDESAEVFTLRSAEWLGGPPMPGPAGLFPGFYLNELLIRLLARQDPHPGLFDAYAATLPSLRQTGPDAGFEPQAALRAFELRLLRELGLLPDLALDTATQRPVDPRRRYRLHPEAGVMAVVVSDLGSAADTPTSTSSPTLSATTLQAVEAALGQPDPARLQAACDDEKAAWRHQLRQCLHYHLGGASLRTRQVRQSVQSLLANRGRLVPSP